MIKWMHSVLAHFIYGLFNETINSSNYMVLKDRTLAHNDSQWARHISKHYPSTWRDKLRKPQKPSVRLVSVLGERVTGHLPDTSQKGYHLSKLTFFSFKMKTCNLSTLYTTMYEATSGHPTSYVKTYLTIFSRSRSSVKPSSKLSLPDEILRRRGRLECPLDLLRGEQAGEVSFFGDCSEWCRLGARPLGSTNRNPHFDSSLSKKAP